MSRHQVSVLTLLFAGLALLPCDVSAQGDSIGVAHDDSAGIAQVVPIPTSVLADAIEHVAQRIRSANTLLEQDPEVDEIASEWPSFTASLGELKDQTKERAGLSTQSGEIDELLRSWEIKLSRLEEWEVVLSRRIAGLTAEIENLSAAQGRWILTGEQARRDSLPKTILTQIDSVVTVIGKVLPRLRSAHNEVLELQGLMTYENVEAVAIQEQLRALRSRALSSLVSRQGGPIWNVFSDSAEWGLGVETRLSRNFSVTGNYLREHVGYVGLQILLIIVLALVAAPLRRHLSEMEAEGGLVRVPVGIFKYPPLPVILVGLLATPLIYPAAPSTFIALTTVFSVPLTILLLMKQARPLILPLIRGVGILVVLFILSRLLFSSEGAVQRIASFLLAGATAGSAAWLLFRSPARPEMETTSFGRLLLAVTRFGLFLALVVVVADLVGYASIAEHTFRALMIGLYSGLYIYVGAQIVIAVVIAGLRTRSSHRLNSIRNHQLRIVESLVHLVNIGAFVYWAYTSLELLGILDPILEASFEFLSTPWGIGKIELSVIDFVAFFVTLWISVKISQIIRVVLHEDILERMDLARGLPTAVSSLTFYALVGLGFMLALSAAGVPLDRVALITGALGIGIGFGLQDIVRNFISGIILMVERPVKTGDTIEFGTEMGVVKKIGIRSSVVRAFEGVDIIVPNSHLVSNEVKNWTLSDTSRRIDVNLTVDHESDPEAVSKILLDVGNSYEQVDKDPAPAVVFTGFSERGLSFSLRCWVHDPTGWLIKRNELSSMVHRRLREAGIKLSTALDFGAR